MKRNAYSGPRKRAVFGGILTGVLALGFILDPLAGHFLKLSYQKSMVRREVRRHIVSKPRNDGVVWLKFTKDETRTLLRWEHPREFEYGGEMYDIIEIVDLGDAVQYRCWWDRQETKLNRQMRALAVQAMGETPKLSEAGVPFAAGPKLFCRTLSAKAKIAEPRPSLKPAALFPDAYGFIAGPPPTPPPEPDRPSFS